MMAALYVFTRPSTMCRRKCYDYSLIQNFKRSLDRSYFCTEAGNSNVSHKCWKCGSETVSPICSACNTIQEPTEKSSYFEVVGIRQRYDLDSKELTMKYRKLQNILHPDRFVNRSKEEQLLSEEYSSLVNKAYATLHNPLSRGLYILELQGLSIEETTQLSDPEFLMDIMEINEKVEMASSAAELNHLDAENKRVVGELSKELSAAFCSNNTDAAMKILKKMKYYSTIESKIKQKRQDSGFE